jgi:2-oxoglutarate dehydrogenase E1 component
LAKVKQKQLPYQKPKLEEAWEKLRRSVPEDFEKSPATGISQEVIDKVGKALQQTIVNSFSQKAVMTQYLSWLEKL